MNWIDKIFKGKKLNENPEPLPVKKIDFIQITTDWNADPNSPEPIIWIEDENLIVDFFLNHFVYDQFQEGDRARIIFSKCSKYSFNHCNDEGYYSGQYRTNPNELPWGEFHEIKHGLDNNFPEPIVKLTEATDYTKHYIFFFRDHTLEVNAYDYKFNVLRKSQIEYELLLIIWAIWNKIQKDSDYISAGFDDYKTARIEVEKLLERIRKSSPKILDDLTLYFAPTGKFQELSIANGWENEYLELAERFDDYKNKNTT